MTEQQRRWVGYFVDYSAPVAFAVVYFLGGRDFMRATWAIVIASVVALVVGLVVERRLAPVPLFVGVMGAIFGGLTLVFHATWIMKLKTSVINLALAGVMLGGVALKKNPLKAILGRALSLPDEVWRKLTVRYGIFYLVLAVLNVIVWVTQPEATWVAFRSFGLQILTLLFTFTQLPLLMRYVKPADVPAPPTEE